MPALVAPTGGHEGVNGAGTNEGPLAREQRNQRGIWAGIAEPVEQFDRTPIAATSARVGSASMSGARAVLPLRLRALKAGPGSGRSSSAISLPAGGVPPKP